MNLVYFLMALMGGMVGFLAFAILSTRTKMLFFLKQENKALIHRIDDVHKEIRKLVRSQGT